MVDFKRFTLKESNIYNQKDVIFDNNIELPQSTACDLLNELHDENHQLKRQIGNLEHTRDFCAESCERLEKENEELKSEIREVQGKYMKLWMNNELTQENIELKNSIKQLETIIQQLEDKI